MKQKIDISDENHGHTFTLNKIITIAVVLKLLFWRFIPIYIVPVVQEKKSEHFVSNKSFRLSKSDSASYYRIESHQSQVTSVAVYVNMSDVCRLPNTSYKTCAPDFIPL